MNHFKDNIYETFKKQRTDVYFCDVTLVSEGNQQIQAHKVILAVDSLHLKNILKIIHKHSHPVIYLRGIKASDIIAIVNFVYNSETNIFQEDLNISLSLIK